MTDDNEESLASQMEKAGLVTKENLEDAIATGFSKLRENPKLEGDDIMKHINGECEHGKDGQCGIASAVQKIYEDAYYSGLYSGAKLGAIGAKRGVTI